MLIAAGIGLNNFSEGIAIGQSAAKGEISPAVLLIIGFGLDPVRVSRLLGHTSPAFTASTYAHMFEHARHSSELRAMMADGYGHLLEVDDLSTDNRQSLR